MRLAPLLSGLLATTLLALAGCEITVGPPSEDQSKPHTIQVPPAQAAVMGKGPIAGKYLFEARMRSKQYGSFDWGRPWIEEKSEDGEEKTRSG